MQVDHDKLKSENTNLITAFREKSRKHQQTQELYDRLKRKEMTAATQSAAYDTVDEVLGSVTNRHGPDHDTNTAHFTNFSRQHGQPDFSRVPTSFHGPEDGYSHRRDGSNGSNGKDGMMPPPPRKEAGYANPGFIPCLDSLILRPGFANLVAQLKEL